VNKLRAKLLKNTTIADTTILTESKFYTEKDMVPTDYPMINVALSGSINGGITPGITQIAGQSKHFKTMFALLLASAYLKHHPDSMMLFYNSEFGSPISYFDFFNIDVENRVVHSPLMNIEQLKFDAVKQLEGLERGDKAIVVIDSIGNLASTKELQDALSEKNIAEVGTRAKALKSFFRMVTPYFTMKNIPCVIVNHTYKTLELYSKDVVSGGTGSYYSSENIWVVGRQQEKEKVEGENKVVGYNFIINVEKSRYVKEKSKIPISVLWNGGIQKHSGMVDLALEAGFLTKSGRSFRLVDKDGVINENVKITNEDLETDEFWNKFLTETTFSDWISKKYAIADLGKDKL